MKQRKEIMDKIIISRKKYGTVSRLVREMRKFLRCSWLCNRRFSNDIS